MRAVRRLPTAGAALVVLGVLLLASPSPVGAQETDDTSQAGLVDVVKVDGLLDPIMVNFLEQSIDGAERDGARWLVLQTNTTGSVVSDNELRGLLDQLVASPVPVAIWIGPSGSKLVNEPARMALVVDELGMAPGTDFGNWGGDEGFFIASTEDLSGRLATFESTADRTVGTTEADELGITTRAAPTIGEFILNLPGVESREVPLDDGRTGREPVTTVRFGQLSLVDQLMHSVASPAVAYLALTIGLSLIVFELFTAGIGVAGVVGAVSLVLACYGLAILPTNWWGLALVGLAFVAFAIDVQTGVPRFWTGVGVVAFVAGSLTLYDGVSLSWITLTIAVIGVLLTFIGGMPSMVRARFSTPTIGREWMIGEMGRAATAIDPNGVVQMKEALWRAYTNRATPIEELDRVRVIGIEGLVLEVEPEEGAARDYRERGKKSAPDSVE